MKKIRINELARELEVKAHEILERLPELGVQEKKTHSSSIDEDVAIKLRRLYGFDVPDLEPSEAEEPEAQVEAGPAGAAEPSPAPIAEARPVPADRRRPSVRRWRADVPSIRP
jgi:translation initiation factor IF-2